MYEVKVKRILEKKKVVLRPEQMRHAIIIIDFIEIYFLEISLKNLFLNTIQHSL